MIKKVLDKISKSIVLIVQIVGGLSLFFITLWYNNSCMREPIRDIYYAVMIESDEDIKEYNQENKNSFKYKDGNEVITIPTPKGYTKLVNDSFKIRSFKGDFLREGQKNLQFYIKEDEYHLLLDSEDRENYIFEAILLLKSDAIDELEAITKELFDDVFKLLTKGALNNEKMIYQQTVSKIEDEGIKIPKVEVKLQKPFRVNENFFYQSMEILMEKDSKMISNNSVTGMLFVNDCFVSYRIENVGFNKLSTLEDTAVQWGKIIHEENN